MKKLLYKSALMFAVWLAAFGVLFLVVQYRFVDAFYHKFTYPAASLIIGTSRAAQGIMPEELRPVLEAGNDKKPLLNYAFTLSHSPFGPAYLKSIKRKLIPGTKNGLFIVAVDPWSLAVEQTRHAEKPENLPEADGFINKLTDVNATPNLVYLKEFYQKPYYRLLLDNLFPIEKLHRDGWLEIDISMSDAAVARRTTSKLQDYSRKAASEKVSPLRIKGLKNTIEFLKKHGDVYLVRIPVSAEIFKMEQEFQPDFDSEMAQIAAGFSVPYFNYSSQSGRYITTDGNHLHQESSRKFSQQLASDILKLKSAGN